MAVQFFLLQCLVICPILLALHWHRGIISWPQEQVSSWDIDNLDEFHSNSTLYLLSIANVPNRQPIVWVHVILLYFISLSWLWLLFVNYWHHLSLLQAQPSTSMEPTRISTSSAVSSAAHQTLPPASSLPHSIHHRSLLVTNIPHGMRHPDTLRQYFASIHIGSVASVTMVYQSASQFLDCALKQRQQWIDRLERHLICLARRLLCVSPDLKLKPFPWADLVTLLQQANVPFQNLPVWLGDLRLLDQEILRLRQPGLSPEYYKPTSTAFVTFESAQTAHICAQAVTSSKPGVLETSLAPEPRDIVWSALLRLGRKDKLVGRMRYTVVFCAVWSLTVFWLFPISFILGLTSIESLSQHFGFLRYFMDASPLVHSFTQNILPTFLVTIFISLLPWILMEISKQQDFMSYSELEDSVLGRYYRFAIFNVVIVFLLGTSFLSSLLDLLYEPTKITQLLAKSLPQGANFFLNYILFNSATHGLELLQIGSQLFGHLILTMPFVANTPRKLLRRTLPWSFPFYYYYPSHILILVIAITYSVIQPMILIFALFYFSLALVVYRHQYAFCYVRRYETCGSRHYRRVASYSSDGLLIFQLTMVGLLYLKGVLPAATAVLPLIIFTVWAKIRLSRLFHQRTKYPFVGHWPSLTSDPADNMSDRASHAGSTAPSTASDNDAGSTAWTFTTKLDGVPLPPQHHRIFFLSPLLHWLDDIWKVSYVMTWWKRGRYDADQSNDHIAWDVTNTTLNSASSVGNDDIHSTNSDVEPLPLINKEKQPHRTSHSHVSISRRHDATAIDIPHDNAPDASPERQLLEWKAYYQDDGCSFFNDYRHPAMLMPLDRRLYLPKDPSLRYWRLADCELYHLDDLQHALDGATASLL
ncbi:DUF221-domain-containing protein [Hesseltinella vesiculosa]|uniref:DUF221-domain-containing protein n=1 Tax=Hesseltinella vesiculosa TaxID=101127 RepID=A0A1X2GPU6_9FUNG|nr:DUF221-domain-containing protein [Hesseltinella vesiculosa]